MLLLLIGTKSDPPMSDLHRIRGRRFHFHKLIHADLVAQMSLQQLMRNKPFGTITLAKSESVYSQ